jgi:formate/nitrite transporter FocA (FNT family)
VNQKKDGRARRADLSQQEAKDVEKRLRLRAPVIYEIVRQEGEDELLRPVMSLAWSGVAAGISIGFSLLAEGILHAALPVASWKPLVESLGYSVGFVIVVLARQQLFTENTITVVLPLMAEKTFDSLLRTCRLWGVVFAANLVGAFIFSVLLMSVAVNPELRTAMIDISLHMMENDLAEMFFKAIIAGWLIAAMVWLLPSAEGAQLWIIVLMTYLIAAGGFTHIIAGSVEAFVLVLHGELAMVDMVYRFLVPVFFGNVVGGTLLFALISYAQVKEEISG